MGLCRIIAICSILAACANTTLNPDASTDPDRDASVTPTIDASVTPTIDANLTPTIDAAPTIDSAGTGQYLDRCTAPGNCASNLCEVDVGGSSYCSKTCASDAQCAYEHICVGLVCRPDDTGAPCTAAMPDACELMCLEAGDGSGECTKPCAAASECPAGYACTRAGGSDYKICVNIEKACTGPNNCGSGMCITGSPAVGCTALCDSAADCPGMLTTIGLPAYTCANAYGSAEPVCVVPTFVIGADPIGASCAAVGDVYCRSGACDTDAPTGPMCTQACTVQGGCAPGTGCYPLVDGGDIHLICNRSGSGDLGDACPGGGGDCHSGLCDTSAAPYRCTRLCNDGLCPTGWNCETLAGFGISLCRP